MYVINKETFLSTQLLWLKVSNNLHTGPHTVLWHHEFSTEVPKKFLNRKRNAHSLFSSCQVPDWRRSLVSWRNATDDVRGGFWERWEWLPNASQSQDQTEAPWPGLVPLRRLEGVVWKVHRTWTLLRLTPSSFTYFAEIKCICVFIQMKMADITLMSYSILRVMTSCKLAGKVSYMMITLF